LPVSPDPFVRASFFKPQIVAVWGIQLGEIRFCAAVKPADRTNSDQTWCGALMGQRDCDSSGSIASIRDSSEQTTFNDASVAYVNRVDTIGQGDDRRIA
jgi:hypothetical protein